MASKNYKQKALELHKEKKGKIEVRAKVEINNKEDLSIAYTPGVAQPCIEIHKNPDDVYDYTAKSNMVAIVTDGSAVLGLGKIGAKASLPVMEGKSVLFKRFANIDAFPIAIDSYNVDEIVKTVKLISPMFGGINLEDISAPRCFEIEDKLKQELDIPVFHDDQHGTAVAVLAGLINALKLVDKKIDEIKIIISGAGAAGIAISQLLLTYGATNIIILDSKGAIYDGREQGMNAYKEKIAKLTNKEKLTDMHDIFKDADVVIGVSSADVIKKEDIMLMNKPIVFAMANPDPEIKPELAREAGAFIIATGRSDYPNQINNVLAFPGIFKGALSIRTSEINDEMKLAAAHALAEHVKNPSPDKIIPSPFDDGVAEDVAEAVKKAAIKTGVARINN